MTFSGWRTSSLNDEVTVSYLMMATLNFSSHDAGAVAENFLHPWKRCGCLEAKGLARYRSDVHLWRGAYLEDPQGCVPILGSWELGGRPERSLES
jgi:hypothetical protein